MDEKFLGSYRLDALVPETHRRWLENEDISKSVTVRQGSQDWAGREGGLSPSRNLEQGRVDGYGCAASRLLLGAERSPTRQ